MDGQSLLREEVEREMNRESDRLRNELTDAKNRAEQAERASATLMEALSKAKQELVKAKQAPVPQGENGSLESAESLRAEIERLRSHIFSLQPYQQEFTADKAGRAYDEVVDGTTHWVTSFLEPILDDPESRSMIDKRRHTHGQILRDAVQHHPDLANASRIPETHVEIAIAIVMRFLHTHIFQTTLLGLYQNEVKFLTEVTDSLQTLAEPKRDTYTVRSWRAEALVGIMSDPRYATKRKAYIRALTEQLVRIFSVFIDGEDSFREICELCRKGVVKPAVALQKKMETSLHHFYIDDTPYFHPGSGNFNHVPFYKNLHSNRVKCEDVLHYRKPFNLTKLDPAPSDHQLFTELSYVMTVSPALYMRKIAKGDVMNQPILVRAEQALVTWGPMEDFEKFKAENKLTQMHRILNEKGPGGGLSFFASQIRSLKFGDA
ncbi:hypothetical protein B0T14DRAFT_438897 [Immersiella caudata]|uniref:Uncharacterized protein n=1 Tax=Immersiella caudata TaxID=314043 RepID=A0AA39WDD4_9PEZI|nr:hypothetical protein B0T14DRAFT_438897 [Immersiella caudata]